MQRTCAQCQASCDVSSDDLAFYDRVSPVFKGKKYTVPTPDLCAECRFQQRLTWRNERSLYARKCDKSGKDIVALYPPDSPYTVYDPTVWWSDAWDPREYGRPFDFSRTFFEQFYELNLAVPKSAIHNAKSENALYTNYSAENRNCYLLVGSLGCEDCYYGNRIFFSKNCVDCYGLDHGELCYECSASDQLYRCLFCNHCHNSSDLTLCSHCIGCHDCFGCINMHSKQYCIFNEQYEKESYNLKRAMLLQDIPSAFHVFEQLRLRQPHQALDVLRCENVTGDRLLNCKNCHHVFMQKDSEGCRYTAIGENDNDCMDANNFDNSELQYNSSNLEKNYHCIACNLVWYSQEAFHCSNCFNSKHLFGCSGMKQHQHCILNAQYTKEEYEALVPRIIDHMQKTPSTGSGQAPEWSRFFPPEHSPFCYNETAAQDFFPLNKEEVIRKGWHWKDEDERNPQKQAENAPVCVRCLKQYRIIPQELAFYRDLSIPVPDHCPDCRHRARLAQQNPRKLWNRQCSNCQKPITTSYAPERLEIVYCESCYLQTVY